MSNDLHQSAISRRFHVAFTASGKESLNYDCSFEHKDEYGKVHKGPRSAEAALHEFHRYMQRTRKINHHEYTIIGLTDSYRDMKSQQIIRDYPITKTANPDLSTPAKIEPEPFTMFDDAEIKEQSKLAEMRFARR